MNKLIKNSALIIFPQGNHFTYIQYPLLINNIINEELKFEITSEDEADFNKPVLFNNCANPITLSYINSATGYFSVNGQNNRNQRSAQNA